MNCCLTQSIITNKPRTDTTFSNRFGGILSAYGLALADVVHEAQEPCAREYNKGNRLMFLLYDLSSVKRPAFCEMF